MPSLGRVVATDHNGVPVIEIHGEVDLSNGEEIESALAEALANRHGQYYIDLSNTTYLDSSGIRMLFGIASRLQARREQLHLIVPKETLVHRVLELTDLSALIPVLSSRSEIDSSPDLGS